MWDVGANIGYFSIYAAKKGLRVLAFEPDQMSANIINKNIYLNNLSNKLLSIPVALNDETKISSFYMRQFLPANAYNTFDRANNQWGVKYKPEFTQGAVGMRGDDIVFDDSLSHFKNPDFIKIDVDGNEYKVLKGMEKILSNTKYICIELGYKHPEYELVQKLLTRLGFIEINDDKYFDKKRHGHGMRNHYYKNTYNF